MLGDISKAENIYLACGYTDMRKSIDGFVLLYKRLENSLFQWPHEQSEVQLISDQQFRWLLEGLSINQPKAVRKMNIKHVI